jgi:hypothetical protein
VLFAIRSFFREVQAMRTSMKGIAVTLCLILFGAVSASSERTPVSARSALPLDQIRTDKQTGMSADVPKASGDIGSLGAWEIVGSMTAARVDFATAISGNHIYALGGAGWQSVEMTTVNSDGSLEVWQTTSPLAGRRARHAAVVSNGYLYALGGCIYDISNGGCYFTNSVERAAINADGSLGTWQSDSPMTKWRVDFAAVTSGGFIYAIAGFANNTPDNTVERATITHDGALGPWQVVKSMTMPRQYLASIASGRFLYVIGGYSRTTDQALTSVEVARINEDGSLGDWQTTSPMTRPREYLAAVTMSNYVYAMGGGNNVSPYFTPSVEWTEIEADGTLKAWQSTNSMKTARGRFGAVGCFPYLYALGGHIGGGGSAYLSSVERAKINLPPNNLFWFFPFVSK